MTGLKRNFAASSDNELVVRLRQSGGQVTHFAWACPITSNRRWPSGLVGSRTGPRMVPFTGVLKGCNSSICGEDARVLLSSTLLPMNSRPTTVHEGHRLTGPALLRVPDLWRMEGHAADAHVRCAGMFDNSYSGPSDASNDLQWGPVFCIWLLVNSLTAYAYDYERRLFSLSLSLSLWISPKFACNCQLTQNLKTITLVKIKQIWSFYEKNINIYSWI